MLGLLVDAALRSIVLGGAVWLSLTLLRVRNPQVCMAAWSVVLIVSMAMPVLTPWMRVTIPSDEASARLVKITWANVPWVNVPGPSRRRRCRRSAPPSWRPNRMPSPRWLLLQPTGAGWQPQSTLLSAAP